MRISEICSRNLDSQIKILRDGSQLHTVLFRHHMLAFRNVTLITLICKRRNSCYFPIRFVTKNGMILELRICTLVGGGVPFYEQILTNCQNTKFKVHRWNNVLYTIAPPVHPLIVIYVHTYSGYKIHTYLSLAENYLIECETKHPVY